MHHLRVQCGTRETSENVFHFSRMHCVSELKRGFCLLGNFGCSQEILSIAAMMQIQHIFVVPSNQKSQAVSPFLSERFMPVAPSLWAFLSKRLGRGGNRAARMPACTCGRAVRPALCHPFPVLHFISSPL